MKMIITIDGGTTNTRCVLWGDDGKILARTKCVTGARDFSEQSGNDALKKAVRTGVCQVMKETGKSWSDISGIVVSGMITSEKGLINIPHIHMPAGKHELAQAVQKKLFSEIAPVPMYFIPGVCRFPEEKEYREMEKADMMRGEETECIALAKRYQEQLPVFMILPGSHNKYISVNEKGKITSCMTSMTGEIFSALIKNTILSSAVKNRFIEADELNEEWLLKGYETAVKTGMGRAAFLTRLYTVLGKEDDERKLESYLAGIALSQDILAVKNSKAIHYDGETIIISGKHIFVRGLYILLKKINPELPIVYDETENLAGIGARIIVDEILQ